MNAELQGRKLSWFGGDTCPRHREHAEDEDGEMKVKAGYF